MNNVLQGKCRWFLVNRLEHPFQLLSLQPSCFMSPNWSPSLPNNIQQQKWFPRHFPGKQSFVISLFEKKRSPFTGGLLSCCSCKNIISRKWNYFQKGFALLCILNHKTFELMSSGLFVYIVNFETVAASLIFCDTHWTVLVIFDDRDELFSIQIRLGIHILVGRVMICRRSGLFVYHLRLSLRCIISRLGWEEDKSSLVVDVVLPKSEWDVFFFSSPCWKLLASSVLPSNQDNSVAEKKKIAHPRFKELAHIPLFLPSGF